MSFLKMVYIQVKGKMGGWDWAWGSLGLMMMIAQPSCYWPWILPKRKRAFYVGLVARVQRQMNFVRSINLLFCSINNTTNLLLYSIKQYSYSNQSLVNLSLASQQTNYQLTISQLSLVISDPIIIHRIISQMQKSIEKINPSIFYDFLPNIKFIRTLGQGAFAQVSLIYDQKQQMYLAVKKIPLFGLCQYERKLVLNQAKILSSIQHPNIIRFHSCLYDNAEENVYIFMEFAKEGDLLNLIFRTRLEKEQIKQKLIWKIISDVAQALNYLHSNNIIHRDVKPANILQQGDTFKLADMNVSKIKEQGKLTCTNVGTPLYTSPQVARHQFYNEKCDIWSLGVVVYELCCFKNPFTKAHIDDMLVNKNQQTKQAIQKIPLRYSRCLSHLIKRMLVKDPRERISINEILHICQDQGMSIHYISSKQKIAEFKTIVFPSQSQRWVNLVSQKHKQKNDLDLTIDEILKESEFKESSLNINEILKESEFKESSFCLKDQFLYSETKIKNQYKQNNSPQKETCVDVILDQDEYCLSNIKAKKSILKTSDRNIIKVDNFLKKEIQNLSKPTHRVLNQKIFLEPSKPRQLSQNKSISTDKRKFHRQRSQTRELSHSRDKQHGEYGFKFIKLSKNFEHYHS